LRSIFLPVNFGPFSFLYCVLIVSDCSEESDDSTCSEESDLSSVFKSESSLLSEEFSFLSVDSENFSLDF